MARIKLTTGRIREFSVPTGQGFIWDTEAPGLAVRATGNGAKSYIFQGKLCGRPIRVTIGNIRAWDIDQARMEARRLKTLIDKGTDPREDRREKIAAAEAKIAERARQDITVAEAWATYLEAKQHKWSLRHLTDHESVAATGGEPWKRGKGTREAGPLAVLMHNRLADLTPDTVAAWLRDESGRRPTYAALAYRLLRAFVRWAASRPEYAGLIATEATSSGLVKDYLQRARAKEGDSLQSEQLRPWFDAVRKIRNPVIAAYLQGLLLTGARREELAGLKWSDVDFQWNSLTIRDKVEGERTIPLTPYLASILALLPRRNEWVFSSPSAASGRIQEPRIRHVQALAAAGLPHVSIHGLRRSFGTLAEWVEAPTGVVAQIMGHKPSAIAEKHYRRRPLDLLRMWHTRIEAWILEQAGIEQPVTVKQGLRLVDAG
jgi:integrase